MTGKLFSLRSLSEHWGTADWTPDKIRRLVHTGQLPYVRVGGRIYFEETVMDQWMVRRRQQMATVTTPRPDVRTIEEELADFGLTKDQAVFSR